MKKVLLSLVAVMTVFYCQAQIKKTVSKSNMVVIEYVEPNSGNSSSFDLRNDGSEEAPVRADERAMELNTNYNTGQTYNIGKMAPPLQGYKPGK